MVRAVDAAVKSGITVVVAAGNSGPNSQTILSPGNSKSAITVGAVDDRDPKANSTYSIAPFSSRGPTKEGLRKPDVVAPGVNIKSLYNVDGYKSLSGTSMATPIVSGSLAILLSQNSGLGPKELKSEIIKSCTNLNEKSDNQGAGVINLNKLFKGPVEDKKSSRPSRSRYSRPRLTEPKPIPVNSDNKSNVAKTSYKADGLIFLLFLLLIFIRII